MGLLCTEQRMLYFVLCSIRCGPAGTTKISDSHGTKLAERTTEWALECSLSVSMWAGGPEKCQDLGMGISVPQVARPRLAGHRYHPEFVESPDGEYRTEHTDGGMCCTLGREGGAREHAKQNKTKKKTEKKGKNRERQRHTQRAGVVRAACCVCVCQLIYSSSNVS